MSAMSSEWNMSARTGKEYRDDGSFWMPLREGFRFALPTDALRLIHTHYVPIEFEHAMDIDGNPISAPTDAQLELDIRRLYHASVESFSLTCHCGIQGGCCHTVYTADGEQDGYSQDCDSGEVFLVSVDIGDIEQLLWCEREKRARST